MNEPELRGLLREVEVPDAAAAERRGETLLLAAFEQRRAQPSRARRPASLPRLALVLALAALVAALLLSPAGAAVRDWVGDVFTTAEPQGGSGLAEIPGGGRLLVQAGAGPWVVGPDGSRRLLGSYAAATWSPHGLFLAAAAGRDLTAVEPDGTPRWTITAPGRVADPRWSPSGFRIAYRSGRALRVSAADGSDDRLLDPSVAPVAPAWSPLGLHQLAYVDRGGRLRIVDADSGAALASAAAVSGVEQIEWAAGTLLEATPAALRVHRVATAKLAQRIDLGPARRLSLPRAARVADAALSPRGEVAAVLGGEGRLGRRGLVVLFGPAGGERRLLNAPGRLSQVLWAPRGGRLLIAWPGADQWLFLPTGPGQGRSVPEVAAAFAPGGGPAAFPRVEGWCCALNRVEGPDRAG